MRNQAKRVQMMRDGTHIHSCTVAIAPVSAFVVASCGSIQATPAANALEGHYKKGTQMKSERENVRLRHAATVLAVFVIAGCGSVNRAYWDAKVEEMCRKDAGVTVFEHVKITSDEYRRLGGVGGEISVPSRQVAKAGAPYVAEAGTTEINRDPRVLRFEAAIVRTSDGKVLARQVNYGRSGGELFRSYDCGNVGIRLDVERQTFEIVGEQK